jgi:hypothetical protein
MAKAQRKTIDKVFILLGAASVVVLLLISALAWRGYTFATGSVKDELASQKIYFPEKGSPALDPGEFPGLQQYGGQLVDDGVKAKAYANEYIGKHLENLAGGKTYAEISSESRQSPTDAKLQAQKQSLFQGETLRGLLLNAYAYWTLGTLMQYVAIVSFLGAAVMFILVLLGIKHLSKLK